MPSPVWIAPPMIAVALWAAAPAGAVFDEPGFSLCTATTAPAPEQNFDMVSTDCCVKHGGVPAPTNYGMGCVAQVDNPAPDYRPTIVLPSRPDPDATSGDPALDELEKLPPLP